MKDNTPAFPAMNDNGYWVGGMTLRDYFAAKALPPMMHADVGRWEGNYRIHAERAYKYADAMMEARK
jgi:hypothetical protein